MRAQDVFEQFCAVTPGDYSEHLDRVERFREHQHHALVAATATATTTAVAGVAAPPSPGAMEGSPRRSAALGRASVVERELGARPFEPPALGAELLAPVLVQLPFALVMPTVRQ